MQGQVSDQHSDRYAGAANETGDREADRWPARFSCGASARRLKYRGPFATQEDFDDNLEVE
jgi:hypothetical protein